MTQPSRYPPAPWRLRGEALIAAAPVRVEAARRFPPPPGVEFVVGRGWTLGGVLLARYGERATLSYHELIVFSGVARVARRPAFVVSHVYVDSRASLRGGAISGDCPRSSPTSTGPRAG